MVQNELEWDYGNPFIVDQMNNYYDLCGNGGLTKVLSGFIFSYELANSGPVKIRFFKGAESCYNKN